MSYLDEALAAKPALEVQLLVVLRRVRGSGAAGYVMAHPAENVQLLALARAGLVKRSGFRSDNSGDQPGYGTKGEWTWTITPAGKAALREGAK